MINIRGLASLGIKSQQHGSLLIPIVTAKLPKELHFALIRTLKQGSMGIEELMELVEKKVEARETSESNSLKPQVRNQTPFQTSASALLTSRSSIKCVAILW